MRRLLVTAGLALGVAATGAPLAPAAPAPPQHLMVYAQEWSLWPSRTHVPAGTVAVSLWNRGQDPHDLRIRPLGHGHVSAAAARPIAAAASGSRTSTEWHLPRGRYLLYCALPEHERLGMHVVISVG